MTAIIWVLRRSVKIINFVVTKSKILMIMTKFIEFTDQDGNRTLANLNHIDTVIDESNTIVIFLNNNPIYLPVSYETFKRWINDVQSAILEAGAALS